MSRNLRRASRTPQTPFDNASQVYEVEAIEAKLRKGGNTEYFVLWKDHQPSDNTWEPMSNLEGSEALVNDFEKTWQENYDAAEAKAANDGVKMHANLMPSLTPLSRKRNTSTERLSLMLQNDVLLLPPCLLLEVFTPRSFLFSYFTDCSLFRAYCSWCRFSSQQSVSCLQSLYPGRIRWTQVLGV